MSSSPGGNSCRAVKFPPVLFSLSRFFLTCLPHLSSLSPEHALNGSGLNSSHPYFIYKGFFPPLFLSKSHKYVARGAWALHGLADFMRQLSAPESIKRTGSLRNQTLVCWFKAWASHKVMALKYNSALKCWGESWKQSIHIHQWEFLSFLYSCYEKCQCWSHHSARAQGQIYCL